MGALRLLERVLHCSGGWGRLLVPTSNDGCYEDIIGNNGLRPEQKIAMAILKLCQHDIRRLGPRTRRWAQEREDLQEAIDLLTKDEEDLMFWCEVAGWDWKIVREHGEKLVKEWVGEMVPLKKRGPSRKPDNQISAVALKKRQRMDRRN